MSDEPESIDVQRRRKGSGDGPSERADAPTRRDSGSGGGGRSGGGASVGKLGGCGGLLVTGCLVVFYLISTLLGGGSDTSTPATDAGGDDSAQSVETAPAENLPTRTPRPTRDPSAKTDGETWLVLLYQDADDEVLEQDIFVDLNEAERVGSSDRVTIVSQVDRFKGGFKGDNWTSARRYLVEQDDDLNKVNSPVIEDLGEVSMAQGQTLVDFVEWGVKTYPADHYVLVFSDHGMGWIGGFSDPSPVSRDPGKAPLIALLDGDNLYLSEIDAALTKIRKETGIEKFDMIGMDACLMSQMEVYAALAPHARYAVASEETEPGLGWAYTGFLSALSENPDMSAEELSASVVKSYIVQDQRIVDDAARNEYLRENSPLGGFFGKDDTTAKQLANQMDDDVTLTAVDLGAFSDLMTRYDDFLLTLQNEDQALVASARTHAQSYSNVFGEKVPPSYIDLGHFVQLAAKKMGSTAVTKASKAVMTALKATVVAEKHGSDRPGSTGIAIYFPNSELYRLPGTGMKSYTKIAERFVKASLWDDFLGFHYNKRSFKAEDTEPVSPDTNSASSRAPGAGKISISPITASSTSADPQNPVKLSAEISGTNIGYTYLMIGLYDEKSNSILLADSDYLESSKTLDLNGVYYPQWPANKFKMNYTWNVGVFSISDGTTSSMALFTPESYGVSAEEAVYAVEGTYTFADSGTPLYARLRFKNGKLFQVLGYNGSAEMGAPAEISPKAGDTFTILQKWMELDAQGNVTQTTSEPGETLTFGNNALFTWKEVFAPAGNYVVGFIVEDYDGNQTASYANIVVK